MNKTFSIFIIDDDEDVLTLARQASKDSFPEAKFTLMCCVKETLAHLVSLQNPLPRLLLLDINLNESTTGFDLLFELRAHARTFSLPIVMLTVNGAKEAVKNAYTLGASTYTVKPETLDQWTEYFRVMRAYWFDAVTPPPTHRTN